MENGLQRTECMTLKEVCAEFRLSRSYVYAALESKPDDGGLKAVKFGSSIRFLRSEVDAWLTRQPAFRRHQNS